jgi:putative ABC transport system permease protein
MTGGAVLRAVSGGVTRRRVQTLVIFLVLTAGAAAALLGLTLATSANAQFLGAFTRQHGAHLAVTFNSAKVTPAQLARTRHLPGVTQAAGPYPETAVFLAGGPSPRPSAPSRIHRRTPHTVTPPGRSPHRNPGSGQPSPHGVPSLPWNPLVETPSTGLAVVGRASRSGPLDDLTLRAGRWATRPGEIDIAPSACDAPIGATVTVTSAPGKPKLKVVGYASSVTLAEQAWVVPSQLAALRAKSAPANEQTLYTFTHAATAAQVSADLAELRAAVPAGAIIVSVSWLDTQSTIAQEQGLNTPFVVAFAVIGLVLAALITASVASAAVVAGYRRIGVLKSIGFTPTQVTATYLAQTGIPALAGAIAGTILGNRWVLPLLNRGPFAAQPVPLWINLTVPAGMLALTGLVTLVPALRAGRLSAVAAIAAGQAPRAGHGYAAHRLAGRLALPRPVTVGLAAPFTRPARSALTLAAVTFGLTAVVLAVGLDLSLAKINAGAIHSRQTVLVRLSAGRRALTPSQQRTIVAALRAQPGTLTYVARASGRVRVPGVGPQVPVTAYQGDAAGLGWDFTSGTWYQRAGQVVVNTARPGTAGLSVGQTIRMTVGGKTVTARITGEVYAPDPSAGALLTSEQTFSSVHAALPVRLYEAVVRPGASKPKYEPALQRTLGPRFSVGGIGTGPHGVAFFGLVDTSLIRLLTILVAILAGLGVLNSVLMLTRERVHDLGVFKAVGMTPRQTIAMVTCWVIAPTIAAAIIALPAGMALQNTVIHAIAGAPTFRTAGLSLTPGGVVHIYTPGGLALLALAGLAIAIVGALGPATWAAASPATTALRAE